MLIAMSGDYTKIRDRMVAELSGFDYYLIKPCDPTVLLQLVASQSAKVVVPRQKNKAPRERGFLEAVILLYCFFGAVLPPVAPAAALASDCSLAESLPSPSLSSLLKSFSNGVPFASSREMEPSLSLSIALPPAFGAAGAPAEVPLDALSL